MAMAAAEVVLQVLPPPPPPREPPVVALCWFLTVPKVVLYLYLAGLWVAEAALGASTVARRALGAASPMVYTLLEVSVGALVFDALVLLVLAHWLIRAMLAAGIASSLRTSAREIQIQSRKVFAGLTWKMLQDPAVLGSLASLFFFLVCGAGCMVLGGLFPMAEESQRERIGYGLYDVGILGVSAMVCFIITPSFVLKVQRIK